LRSFAPERSASPFLSVACALFAKIPGVYSRAFIPISGICRRKSRGFAKSASTSQQYLCDLFGYPLQEGEPCLKPLSFLLCARQSAAPTRDRSERPGPTI